MEFQKREAEEERRRREKLGLSHWVLSAKAGKRKRRVVQYITTTQPQKEKKKLSRWRPQWMSENPPNVHNSRAHVRQYVIAALLLMNLVLEEIKNKGDQVSDARTPPHCEGTNQPTLDACHTVLISHCEFFLSIAPSVLKLSLSSDDVCVGVGNSNNINGQMA